MLEALKSISPEFHSHLFTTAPQGLFSSLDDYTLHHEPIDIGVVQDSALTVDIPATIARLAEMLPYCPESLAELAARCAGCSFILCDIAPIAIAVGQRSGIPTVLLENFTWDWIYEPYCERHPELRQHVKFLAELFPQANYRIQTEPLCREKNRDIVCGPIFRQIRMHQEEVRTRLQVAGRSLILITLGGIAQKLPELRRLEEQQDLFFVIAGQPHTEQVTDNCLLLQRDADVSHPDLIGAADLVVCKAGYSTIAECRQAGARVVVIDRDYPESRILQDFVKKVLGGVLVSPALYERGEWLPFARELLRRRQPAPAAENGADKAADFLAGLL